MSVTKEEIIGGIGAAIFAALFLLILLFSHFTLHTPPQELGGIPVLFGNMEDAGGDVESPMNEMSPVHEPSPSIPQNSPNEPLITQNREPSIDVQAQREEERKRRALQEERRRAQEEANRQRDAENRRREIDQQMSGLFGENSGSRGTTQGAGTQGVSTGNATQGAPTGVGGMGHTYNLGGRKTGDGGLVSPRYAVNEEGTVVVNIKVDPKGNVIDARIGRGTTTPNTNLRNEALRAARQTKFTEIDAVNNQEGTITYKFKLK